MVQSFLIFFIIYYTNSLTNSAPKKNACPHFRRAFLNDFMSQSELTTFNFPQQTHPRWATKRDPSQTTGTPCPVEEPGPALPATKPHGSTFPVIVFNHTFLFKTPIKNNCFSLMPFFYVHSMPFTNQNYYFKTKLPFQAC